MDVTSRMRIQGALYLALSLTAVAADAQNVPRTMNIDGVVRNVAGEVVTGTLAVRIHLFPTANCLGTEQVVDAGSLPVIGGVFSQNLDLSSLGNYFADKAAASMKVEVAGVLFGDCRAITSVAYALKAEQAATAANAMLLGGQNRAYYEGLSGSTGPVDDSRLSTKVVLRDDPKTISGVMNFAPATGSIPFTVDPARNGIVINLNADRLDGQDGAFYQTAGNLLGTLPDGVVPANVAWLTGAQTFTGTKTFSPSGSAPFLVDTGKTGVVTNLNADLLDGQQGAWYQDATNLIAGTVNDARLSTNVSLLNTPQTYTAVKTFNPGSGTVPFAVPATRNGKVDYLNADLLDDHEGAYYMPASSAGSFIANGTVQQAGANFNIQGNGVAGGSFAAGTSLSAGTNQYVQVGAAYLSSGGDYVHLANNEWYNGSNWVSSAAGAMFQLSGQSFNFYTHSADGVVHTQLASMDGTRMDVRTDVSLNGKHAFRATDSWLRLNQDGAFTSGTHTPNLFAPNSLNVGGLNGWADPGGTNAVVAGRMGIGISPNASYTNRLEVQNPTGNAVAAVFHSSGGQSYGQVLAVVTDGGYDEPKILFNYRGNQKNWSIGGYSASVTPANTFSIFEDGGDAGAYGAGFGTARLTVSPGGNVGINTMVPDAVLDVHGKGMFSRDGTTECCGSDATLALAETTVNAPYRKSSISFHNGGLDEGILELNNAPRRIRLYDHQNLGLSLELTGDLVVGGNPGAGAFPRGGGIVTAGQIQARYGGGTGLDRQWHRIEFSANCAMMNLSIYATGRLDGDIRANAQCFNSLFDTGQVGWWGFSDTQSWAADGDCGKANCCDNCDHFMKCPDGWLATGMEVYANDYLDHLGKLRCTKLAAGWTTTENGYGVESAISSPWNPGADNIQHFASCPPNTFVKGVIVNVSNYWDGALRVYCSGVRNSAL